MLHVGEEDKGGIIRPAKLPLALGDGNREADLRSRGRRGDKPRRADRRSKGIRRIEQNRPNDELQQA